MKRAELEAEIEAKQEEIARLHLELEVAQDKLAKKERTKYLRKDVASAAEGISIVFEEMAKKGFSKEETMRLVELSAKVKGL